MALKSKNNDKKQYDKKTSLKGYLKSLKPSNSKYNALLSSDLCLFRVHQIIKCWFSTDYKIAVRLYKIIIYFKY